MKLSRGLRGSIALLLAGAAPLAFAAEAALVAKQLSGPPSEFEMMRPVAPGAAAIHSKSALLRVEMTQDKSGQFRWQGALPVESEHTRMLVFSGGDGWQAELAAPGRAGKALGHVANDLRAAQFGTELATFPADYYALDSAAKGANTLTLRAGASAAHAGFVLIEGDAATQLSSYSTGARQIVGNRVAFAALLTRDSTDGAVAVGKGAGRVDDATLEVTAPDGRRASYPMFDDGKHGDGVAGDGTFGASFVADSEGQYQAQVIVHGANADGQAIVRSAEHVVPILEPTLALASAAANAVDASPSRTSIRIPIAESAKRKQAYRAIAEVWGTDASGAAAPVAWIGGMVEPAEGALSLGFDKRWVALAKVGAPFELRNLRIEDADHFVTVASAERMALALPTMDAKLASRPVLVDEAMTMGPRPERLVESKGVGTKLLLIHGYCSGGVWPAAQFSNAATFLDVNQSRSNDQFARLIQSFGNTWNSYGTVSHSQGGMATLHLYTYYWSGLDNATGNRLLQSVGTPYQGTNLAGILATLGSWFGVGCGTNDNLTYSGAAAWLAGIPSWARAKVNYYTASFRLTNWWTNDYCNFATDLVLSDPEDGTTEKAYGQLPGAINQGHVTGECHTTGMRDPAEYLDSSRNSIMSANAAR